MRNVVPAADVADVVEEVPATPPRASQRVANGASRGGVHRIFIVGEVRLYREGLEQVLSRDESIDVVGSGPYREQAVARIRELRPDITLLDLGVPDGAEAVRRLLEAVPGMRVVVLAIPEAEPDFVAWAEAGISGYVSRDGSLAELLATIESVARDEMPCSPRMAAALLRHVAALAARAGAGSPEPRLTHREYEILNLVGRGLSNKEIARVLTIALPTVKNHMHNILEKLQVRRRADAVLQLGTQAPRSS